VGWAFKALKLLCDIYSLYKIWNVAIAREWDFTAQMVFRSGTAHLRTLEGTLAITETRLWFRSNQTTLQQRFQRMLALHSTTQANKRNCCWHVVYFGVVAGRASQETGRPSVASIPTQSTGSGIESGFVFYRCRVFGICVRTTNQFGQRLPYQSIVWFSVTLCLPL